MSLMISLSWESFSIWLMTTSLFQISSGKHAGIAAELIELSPEAFWILGLLNNFLWVVMNAGAGSINEDCQKCGEFRYSYLQNHRTSIPIPMLPIRLMIKNCEKEPMRDTNPGIPDIETQKLGFGSTLRKGRSKNHNFEAQNTSSWVFLVTVVSQRTLHSAIDWVYWTHMAFIATPKTFKCWLNL